jgi:L-alanine-DL-glutamate epimerase-like enolase superfamily enzyme
LLKVRSVTTAVVEANFDWTIIRVEDDDGRVGWGEAFFAPGLTSIVTELAALVVGHDTRHVQPIVDRLRLAASGAGSAAGLVSNAISGIDAALWDLAARTLDVPLWRMLGGRLRDRVRLYADCHADVELSSLGPLLQIRRPSWSDEPTSSGSAAATSYFDPPTDPDQRLDPDRLADRARAVAAAGFDAVKFDVDVPGLLPRHAGSRHLAPAAIGAVADMLDAVRRGAGAHIDVALDCHWRYDAPTALRIAEACADRGVLWLEDAMPPEHGAALAVLAARSPVPLGGGENLNGWAAFEPLLRDGALAVATPDFAKLGGLDEARTLARVAERHGAAIAPHNISGPVGTAFAAQLASTMPNFLVLEFHAFDVPFFVDLVDRPVIVDGAVPLGDAPGIGVEVVVDEVRRWAKSGEPVFGDAL